VSLQSAVPTYALYGEYDENLGPEWLHCETIAARSARHNWIIRSHRHSGFFQILFLSKGRGTFMEGERAQALRSPCAVLVPPQTVHGFRFSRDVRGHVVTLVAARLEQAFAEAPEVLRLTSKARVVDLSADRIAADQCALGIGAVAEEFEGHRSSRSALMHANLLTALVWLARAAERNDGNFKPSRAYRQAMNFRVLVDAHFRSEHGVRFYAKQLGITPTHLNRIAREVFDCSALGLIGGRLLMEARRELTFTVRPVNLIAESLGFSDAAYFTRFFTRHVGVSPRRFRTASSQHE